MSEVLVEKKVTEVTVNAPNDVSVDVMSSSVEVVVSQLRGRLRLCRDHP